jgi:hypothetical protein
LFHYFVSLVYLFFGQGKSHVFTRMVILQNTNAHTFISRYFPEFRTSEDFVWFVAVDKKKVIGFIPVEEKKKECIINNYYIEGNNESTLKLLLEKVISETTASKELTSVAFMEHCSLFKELGFSEEKVWTRYVKMKKDK